MTKVTSRTRSSSFRHTFLTSKSDLVEMNRVHFSPGLKMCFENRKNAILHTSTCYTYHCVHNISYARVYRRYFFSGYYRGVSPVERKKRFCMCHYIAIVREKFKIANHASRKKVNAISHLRRRKVI